MKKTLNKGFTLIELLVVIAIIGILATIVLSALGDARDKARYTSAQASISQVRTVAEVYYSDNGDTYASLCVADEYTRLEDAATAQGATVTCNAQATDGQSYAVTMEHPGGMFFCIDSDGDAETSAGSSTGTRGNPFDVSDQDC